MHTATSFREFVHGVLRRGESSKTRNRHSRESGNLISFSLIEERMDSCFRRNDGDGVAVSRASNRTKCISPIIRNEVIG